MTRNLVRHLVRLAVPVAALLAIASTSGTAEAHRPQLGCTYGIYTAYYDASGSLCAESETCNNTSWGTCDEDLTFAYSEEWPQLCYCEP